MNRVWTVLAHPWHDCYLDALPFLAEPGDVVRTVAPADYEPASGRTEIVFGVARCPETWGKIKRAPHVIPYETENMLADGPHRAPSLDARAALRRPWLNYSRANARAMGDIPLPPRRAKLPMRKPGHLARADVLFVGSINRRRAVVLEQLREAGVSIVPVTTQMPLFGAELRNVARSCRLLLNVHYYAPGVFEVFRCAPMLNWGVQIISEDDAAGEADEWCAASHPYEKLVDVVLFALGKRPAAAH